MVVEGQTGKKTLPKQFIEEALLISDLFDLNEYAAVELLLSGKLSIFLSSFTSPCCKSTKFIPWILAWLNELNAATALIKRGVSWPSGLLHQIQVLTLNHQSVGSNPGHDTCVLEQDT